MIDSNSWGKFTAKGSQKVEDFIRRMVEEIVIVIADTIPEKQYKCLYMLGGYGRGEGGVVIINGQELPHNNFDLMLVANDVRGEKLEEIKAQIDSALEQLKERIGIGIDVSVINASKLRSSACRILWYDMKYGHKMLLGNTDIIATCQQFKLRNIPAWDARNLLVNRGTLLIINDLIMKQHKLDLELKKVLIRHTVKSIIGYGDCLLYFLGDYDWSYLEKQKRMQARSDVNPDFKKLYDDAMNFRFQPDYEPFLLKDFSQWMKELKQLLQNINLLCESKRLHRRKLDWDNYIYIALAHGISEAGLGIKAWGKRLINYSNMQTEFPGQAPMSVKMGYKFLGEKGVLSLIYPLIAYNMRNQDYRKIARGYLQVKNFNFEDLRSAYLKKWGHYMDTNFSNLLQKYDIKLK
ncbi:MAG: hypothetical protein K9M99_10335 [Candidatus Cloacimonetes bacterium]|nr:hypothetical protein [Candidatus Cloacimonadota bacterium]